MRRERESTIYTVRAGTRNSYYNSHTLLPHFISFNSLMFSPFCGHVIPANGGTRMQFGEALFRPNCPVIRCEHCQQLIPSTTITPHQPTSHIPVDQQLRYTHASSYTPASGSDTRSSIATNRTDSFADFKAASFQKALLTAQKGRQSSNITINSGQPSASVSQQHNSTQQRNRKINQSEKTIPPLDDHPLSPPLSVVHKYSLKLIISHFDTPFKLEAVPHTEEWSPTTEELKHNINGIYCTSTFGHIIKQTGLWDTLTTMKPNCMFNDFPVRIADAKHMKSYGTLLSLQ